MAEQLPSQIVLIVAYDGAGAISPGRIISNEELVDVLFDGKPYQPRTRQLREIYRWLQSHGYAPGRMNWLRDTLPGDKRKRRQEYNRTAG